MGLAFPPTRVSRRSNTPVLAGMLVTAGFLAAAFLLAGGDGAHAAIVPAGTAHPGTSAASTIPSPAPAAPAVAERKDEAQDRRGAAGRGTSGAPDAALAHAVRCHAIGSPDCERIARSAAGLVAGGAVGGASQPIATVDVWRSLVCGDTLECPPALLRHLVPLGSAVVSLAGDAGQVWVNVAERMTGGGAGSDRPSAEAWIVGWFR